MLLGTNQIAGSAHDFSMNMIRNKIFPVRCDFELSENFKMSSHGQNFSNTENVNRFWLNFTNNEL